VRGNVERAHTDYGTSNCKENEDNQHSKEDTEEGAAEINLKTAPLDILRGGHFL
jgi:hypothetical protein